MALQRDGKIVLAGQTKTPPTQDLLGNLLTLLHNGQSFMAARLQSNGQPDPSFGMGGIDTIPIGQTATGFSVAVRGNGRILLAGNAYTTQLVAATAQLLPNGALDPSYGSGGIATLPVAQGINAMTLASQGRILLAGVGASAIRLLPGGAPDPSFGNGGIVTVPIGSDGGAANGVTVAPHNKIVLVGAATLAGKIAQTVIRLNG
jgi:uncharacterized delta-60 repeat protein